MSSRSHWRARWRLTQADWSGLVFWIAVAVIALAVAAALNWLM